MWIFFSPGYIGFALPFPSSRDIQNLDIKKQPLKISYLGG